LRVSPVFLHPSKDILELYIKICDKSFPSHPSQFILPFDVIEQVFSTCSPWICILRSACIFVIFCNTKNIYLISENTLC
jgi:hypothetical protein